MVESILAYLGQSLLATLIQILILFFPGLILTLIFNWETGIVQRYAISIIGRGWYLGLFGWLGTIVHELGHALFCLIFGHKITDMQLFHPDSETGTLGYVKHSYNRSNLYQLLGNFFIGIGPIILGTAVIYLSAYCLLGLNPFNSGLNAGPVSSHLYSWEAFRNIFLSLGNSCGRLLVGIFSLPHLLTWQLYVFLYLGFILGSSLTLSPPDIKAALSGFAVIVVLILFLNLATIWAGNWIFNLAIGIAAYSVLFYTILFLIMLITAVVALVVVLPLIHVNARHSKAA